MAPALSLSVLSATLILTASCGPTYAALSYVHDDRNPVVGNKTQIEWALQIDGRCSVIGVPTVKIFEAPQHGHLSAVPSKVYPRYALPDRRARCDKRQVEGLRVYYEPESGFVGHDRVKFRILFSDGTGSNIKVDLDVSARPGGQTTSLKRLTGLGWKEMR